MVLLLPAAVGEAGRVSGPVRVNHPEERLLELDVHQHGPRLAVEVRGGAVGVDSRTDVV